MSAIYSTIKTSLPDKSKLQYSLTLIAPVDFVPLYDETGIKSIWIGKSKFKTNSVLKIAQLFYKPTVINCPLIGGLSI